jgi:hypothetical protein
MLFESSTPSASVAGAASCAAKPLSFISGKAMFASGNDAINLLTAGRPVQPSAKLLDNWFNGNSTHVNVNAPRPKATTNIDSKTIRMTMAM